MADTSVLYALFSRSDVHHEQAKAAVADPEPIVVPAEVLSETVALVQYRHGFEAAHRAGAFLKGLPHVDVVPATLRVLDAAWDAHARSEGRLSYPDAVVLATCDAERARPLAFDKALLNAHPD